MQLQLPRPMHRCCMYSARTIPLGEVAALGTTEPALTGARGALFAHGQERSGGRCPVGSCNGLSFTGRQKAPENDQRYNYRPMQGKALLDLCSSICFKTPNAVARPWQPPRSPICAEQRLMLEVNLQSLHRKRCNGCFALRKDLAHVPTGQESAS